MQIKVNQPEPTFTLTLSLDELIAISKLIGRTSHVERKGDKFDMTYNQSQACTDMYDELKPLVYEYDGR